MKLYLRTFGCRANHYDSESVRALAERGGYEIVDNVDDADVAVFNSCAVTAEAEREARKAVRGAAARNPRLRSIVMGCSSALPQSQSTLRALPGVVKHLVGVWKVIADGFDAHVPRADRQILFVEIPGNRLAKVSRNAPREEPQRRREPILHGCPRAASRPRHSATSARRLSLSASTARGRRV